MSKVIIDEIIKAEKSVAEIRRSADTYARELFEETSAKSEKIYSEAIEKAEMDVKNMREKANSEAKAKIDSLRMAAYSKAAQMTEKAEKNMDRAVELIVNGIIEE